MTHVNDMVHIVTQDNQPYGSARRCCQNCGRMCWPEMGNSAKNWVTTWDEWRQSEFKCSVSASPGDPEYAA